MTTHSKLSLGGEEKKDICKHASSFVLGKELGLGNPKPAADRAVRQ